MKWIKEISYGSPFLLVGTHIDKRDEHNPSHISSGVGQTLARNIRACKYIECSISNQGEVKGVFDAAIL